MAKIMNDEQRLAILEAYNPQEHLISVGTNKDRTPVLYYPAAWRLYELRLRHPSFVLEAEIIHMDEEHGTVIVKAIGYDGLDYASSCLKGTAFKQGKLAELDKVETKAKSRVARDIGIGTEYALDMDADETDATHTTTPQTHKQVTPLPPVQVSPEALKAKLKAVAQKAVVLGLATDYKSFYQWAGTELGISIMGAASLTIENLSDIESRLSQLEGQAQQKAS